MLLLIRMEKSLFVILFHFVISVILGNVYSIGNDQQENKFLPSPPSGKAFGILQDILNHESSLHFSMVQKIKNLVMDAIENNNITEVLRKKLVYLGNKVNSIQSENRKLEELLDKSFDGFRKDQNATNLQLRNVPSVPQQSHRCFFPFDCFDIYNCGERGTDVYDIYPFTTRVSTKVVCDMDTVGGGWTVIQNRNRENPIVNFSTTWNQYKQGFGNVFGNYWLGNDAIHKLTTKYSNSLFIRLKNTRKQSFVVQYSSFSISDETGGYRLSLGVKSGNISDAFRSYNVVNASFYTFDHDNNRKCAASRKSGWWFISCTHTNLNAPFFESHGDGVWSGTISQGKDLFLSEMLIKRT